MLGNTKKSDALIQKQVVAELGWETRIKGTDVGVEVHDGTVTLTGTVDSYAKKLVAQHAAHLVAGVLDVANDIRVQILPDPGRTDTEIAQALRRALEWDALVADDRILSTVSDGWVTLTGEVDHLAHRHEAERAISSLLGVKGVTNAILVKPTTMHPSELKKRIEQTLARRFEREFNRLGIVVDDHGNVSVSGVVPTWKEAQSILGSIRFAPGVLSVENALRVDPGL